MVIQDSKVLQDNYLAKELFRFTFEVLERTMLIATASSLNEGSLALQRAYGFEEVCRIPDAFSDGEDMVISTLTRERHMRRRIH
jgi:RimJ/RimL family protein N-acetyltransferase